MTGADSSEGRRVAPSEHESQPTPARWSVVLRSLREAAGATQAGWAARLGFGRTTVQRWESGELPPGPDAEAALLRTLAERGLFRTYYQGPLRGLTVGPDLIRDLLAEARLHGSRPRAERGASRRGQTERASSGAPQINLPSPRTSFVGRQRDLQEIEAMLRAARLVTLTGPGGAGKTRLAIHVAGPSASRFPDGVWLVDLSVVTDPVLVARSAATVLGLREQRAETPLDALIEKLHDARALIVLDNCEHVLAACAQLVDRLLASCSGLYILATSRQVLGVAGELSWLMSGLNVPPAEAENWPPEQVGAWDAVRLFVERAAAVRPGFVLDERNLSAVLGICRRLDGLPLAIELAAARTGVMAPAQIASRLDDRLQLLKTSSVTTAPRQQTLRATLDWSHDLLAEQERVVLRRLAVFAGGWTLEAAEMVADGDASSVLDALSSLIARSLVMADVGADEARYRLLETVRQYATEKLTSSGEQAATRDAHLRWCVALAEAAEPHLRGAQQASWLERLETELDNVRAALTWSLIDDVGRERVERSDAGLRLAALLRWFWFTRGRPGEGRTWLERGLAAGAHVAPATRARALDAVAALAHNQGDYSASRSLQEDALRIWHAEGDRRAESAALSTLGIIAKAQGEYERARTLLEDALALTHTLGETATEATVLNNLAALAMDVGDYTRARELLQQSLIIKRALGDAAGIATSLHNLGEAAQHLGEYHSALELLSESLALFRQLAATDRIAQTLHSLGLVALRRGDLDGAAVQFAEAMTLFQRNGDGWGQVVCLEGMAEVASAAGHAAHAARLFGAADGWREANGAPLPPNDRPDHDRAVAAVASALGQTQFAVAWADGRAQGLDVEFDRARAATPE